MKRFRAECWTKVRERLLVFAMGLVVAGGLLYSIPSLMMLPKLFVPNLIHKRLYTSDDWLGHKFNRNVTQRIHLKGRADVIQTTDDFGRRTTVQPPGNDYRSFAVFAPDSMLFGVNVNDDQTVASRFAHLTATQKIKSYNYAVSGYGPNHFLALVTDPRFQQGIPEKRGFVVYSFIDLHIERAACWPFIFKVSPNTRLPRYVIAADGSVQRAGMARAKDVPYGLPATIRSFNTASTWLGPYSDPNRTLTARLLGQAKKELEKRFELQGFFVIFLNGSDSAEKMTALLEPMGIHCFDYRPVVKGWCGEELCLQKENGHPSVSGNRAIAEQLVQDLRRFGVLQ